MARFASVNEFSPAGTVVSPGPAVVSNAIAAAAAQDARVFLHATAVAAGASMEVEIQVSHDNSRWAAAGSFNTIDATGDYVFPIPAEKLASYIRLKYTAAVGAVTFQAVLEKKQGL